MAAPLVNLEKKFDDKKGVYVLTLDDKSPYKIGTTNDYIGKRIQSYVNCPSSHEGHFIHLLLTWDKSSTLDARVVETFVFNELKDYQLQSNMRRNREIEHFDATLGQIKTALIKAKKHYKGVATLSVTTMKHKNARIVKRVGKQNFSSLGKGLNINGKGNKLSTHGQMIVFLH